MAKNNKDKILGATVALLALIVAELNSSAPEAASGEPEATPDKGKGNKSGAAESAAPEVEAGGEGPTLASLREKAQKLLADGKAADVKKALAKFKAESLTKLDAKHYVAMDSALDALSVE
jgi:hypothetical protein